MRGLRWTGGRRPERSLREHLRPRSMAAMRRRFPIADCDHGEARRSRKMDGCEGRISARELVARRCWASVRSSAVADLGPASGVGWQCVRHLPVAFPRRSMTACHCGLQPDRTHCIIDYCGDPTTVAKLCSHAQATQRRKGGIPLSSIGIPRVLLCRGSCPNTARLQGHVECASEASIE